MISLIEWAILIVVGAAGVAFAWVARYRRVDTEHAFCRLCSYQLATTVPLSLPEMGPGEDEEDAEDEDAPVGDAAPDQGESGDADPQGGADGGEDGIAGRGARDAVVETEAPVVESAPSPMPIAEGGDDGGAQDGAVVEEVPSDPAGREGFESTVPALPVRCPECGNDLTMPRAVEWGRRAPSKPRILIGSAVALLVSAVLFASHAEDVSRFRWTPWLPTAWLLRTDITGSNDYGNSALTELRLRLANGELTDSQQARMARMVAERARNTFRDIARRGVAWTGSSLLLLQNHKPDDVLVDELLEHMMSDHWAGERVRLAPMVVLPEHGGGPQEPFGADSSSAVGPSEAPSSTAGSGLALWVDAPIPFFGPYNQPYVPNAAYPALLGFPLEISIRVNNVEVPGRWTQPEGFLGFPVFHPEEGSDLAHVLRGDGGDLAPDTAAAESVPPITAVVTVGWYFMNEDLAQLMHDWQVQRTTTLMAVNHYPLTEEMREAAELRDSVAAAIPGSGEAAAAFTSSARPRTGSSADAHAAAVSELMNGLRLRAPLVAMNVPPVQLTRWHETQHEIGVLLIREPLHAEAADAVPIPASLRRHLDGLLGADAALDANADPPGSRSRRGAQGRRVRSTP